MAAGAKVPSFEDAFMYLKKQKFISQNKNKKARSTEYNFV
jgi:hypothetical protein